MKKPKGLNGFFLGKLTKEVFGVWFLVLWEFFQVFKIFGVWDVWVFGSFSSELFVLICASIFVGRVGVQEVFRRHPVPAGTLLEQCKLVLFVFYLLLLLYNIQTAMIALGFIVIY